MVPLKQATLTVSWISAHDRFGPSGASGGNIKFSSGRKSFRKVKREVRMFNAETRLRLTSGVFWHSETLKLRSVQAGDLKLRECYGTGREHRMTNFEGSG